MSNFYGSLLYIAALLVTSLQQWKCRDSVFDCWSLSMESYSTQYRLM